jgi:hypothetical protein
MTIKVTIKDGRGSGREASVDENHAVSVTNIGLPPSKLNATLKPFAEFLKSDADTEDMRIDGSTTNVDYFIQAGNDGDRYIQTLAFTIADASASLNQFGNLAALTNGCDLVYEDRELGDVVIASALKTNFDFVQLCNFEPSFGTGSDAFLASNVSGASEAYIPILDITDVFGLPYGLRLPQGRTKKLKIVIKDNTTGIDRFDVKAFGFDRIPNTEE